MSPFRRGLFLSPVAAIVIFAAPAWCCVGLGPGMLAPRDVVVEASGDFLVVDGGFAAAVVRIDAVTGDRTIVSNADTGTGPAFTNSIRTIAIEASGDVVVIDSLSDAIIRVDTTTGDRTIVSDAGTGAGPEFPFMQDIAVEASGDLVVTDLSLDAVIRVDPVTGDRTIISKLFSVGTGPGFATPAGIAVEASGDLVVVDGLRRVVRVDPVTGDRTVVSDDTGVGTGPTFLHPRRIAVEAGGDLIVTDGNHMNAVVRVDPVTGDRTIVSNAVTGSGPLLGEGAAGPEGLAVEASGDWVVANVGPVSGVMRIDPVTGDRAFVSVGSCFGVTARKLVVVDKLATSGRAKVVYVSKDSDAGIRKGGSLDGEAISVEFTATYLGAGDSASGAFVIPSGASDGTAGWLVNKVTVAKFVNKAAPAPPTEARVAVIKPDKLLKLVGKGLGDTPFDILAAGEPVASVFTAYCVTDQEEHCHCTEFPDCSYKLIAADTGAKMVCKNGVPDAACTAVDGP
jgi:streptogramin lyase